MSFKTKMNPTTADPAANTRSGNARQKTGELVCAWSCCQHAILFKGSFITGRGSVFWHEQHSRPQLKIYSPAAVTLLRRSNTSADQLQATSEILVIFTAVKYQSFQHTHTHTQFLSVSWIWIFLFSRTFQKHLLRRFVAQASSEGDRNYTFMLLIKINNKDTCG